MELVNSSEDMAWLARRLKQDLGEFGSAIIDNETNPQVVYCYFSLHPLITDVRVAFRLGKEGDFQRVTP